jgi:hypothetical protein
MPAEAHGTRASYSTLRSRRWRFTRGAFSGKVESKERLSFDYADFLADFSGEFHFLSAAERKRCLRPTPVPECYGPSQAVARSLFYSGSSGIVYPSVRHEGGTCIACFRPALIFHPRRGKGYRLTLAGGDERIQAQKVPL